MQWDRFHITMLTNSKNQQQNWHLTVYTKAVKNEWSSPEVSTLLFVMFCTCVVSVEVQFPTWPDGVLLYSPWHPWEHQSDLRRWICKANILEKLQCSIELNKQTFNVTTGNSLHLVALHKLPLRLPRFSMQFSVPLPGLESRSSCGTLWYLKHVDIPLPVPSQ